jgi:hypothetical protein
MDSRAVSNIHLQYIHFFVIGKDKLMADIKLKRGGIATP